MTSRLAGLCVLCLVATTVNACTPIDAPASSAEDQTTVRVERPLPAAWHPSKGDVGLEDFRAERLGLLEVAEKEKLRGVLATVTFEEPIEPERALELLQETRTREVTIYLRDGADGVSVGTHEIETSQSRDRFLDIAGTQRGLLGVVAAVVDGPAEGLAELQRRDEVYLVDVSVDPAFLPDVPDRRPAHSVAWELWHLRGSS